MKYQWVMLYLGILGCFSTSLCGQSVLELDSCGFSYIDPQDELNNSTATWDTLVYTSYFNEENRLQQFFVDVNAFGGSQVDRVQVSAITADNTLKPIGSIAFGNCVDCVQGFALINNNEVLVSEIDDQETMNMWLLSQNQPPFALTGNLQTLVGVGRVGGHIPPCAIGIQVKNIVFSNPANTSTEFAVHVLCPEIIRDCSIQKEVLVDCINDSISLNAIIPPDCFAPDAIITWSNNAGVEINSRKADLPLSGNEGWYYITIEDDCCTVIDSVLVENPPFANAGPDLLICQGETQELRGIGGSGHFWEFIGGLVYNDSIAVISDAQNADDGFYVLHAFNEEGCEDTDTLNLTVNIPPLPEIQFEEPCIGDTLFLSVQNDSLYTQLNWLNVQGNSTPPLNANFQTEDIGLYTLITIDSADCEVPHPFTVNGFQLPAIEFLIEEACDSNSIYAFPEDYNYLWETGDVGLPFVTSIGDTYQVTVTDAQGCSTQESVLVPQPDGPIADLNIIQPICPNDYGAIEITVDDPDRPVIFSVNGGETYALSPNFDRLLPGDYRVVVQDDLGCIQEVPVTLIEPDTMGVILNYEELTVRPTTPVSFFATTIGNIEEYQWIPEEINTGEPSTEFIAMGSLDVRIVVKDDRGCLASDGFPLSIVLGDIYAPNAFSPDEDGINDRFIFYSDNGSGEIIEFLRIYNRYGALVFEAKDVNLNDESQGWDGRFLGKPMGPGVFAYHGRVRYGNGAKKVLKGDVTLMR